MSAKQVARALGGRKVGASWMARCPAHDDRTPSLSITDAARGRVLVHCHAGCDQRAVIAALRLRGAWPDGARSDAALSDLERYRTRPPQSDEDSDRARQALGIWRASVEAQNTPVQTYLHCRGLDLSIPPTIRFHRGLRHPSGGVWPGMVALVVDGATGSPVAVHRTYLARDGSGKAPVEPNKMMLGPCRGGAVRLGDPAAVLMVGEGIETCLAAMQATGNASWAALSTSGLRSLDLPREVRDVIVLADGDDPGEAAAQDCARRWKRQGLKVRIARPPRGLDFNDVLNFHNRPAAGRA